MKLVKYLHDLQTFPGDGLRAWRSGGWVAVRKEIRRRTLGRLGGYVRRFLIETDLHQLVDAELPPEVDIRPFTGPDWTLLGNLGRSRMPQQFAEASAAGRTCLIAWKRRQAVGYVWFSTAIESRHERYDLMLPADTVYVWQIEVIRSERSQGVGAALLSRGLELCRERGFHRSWIIVHPNNFASIRTVASVAPSRVLGTVGRVKVLSWMRSWYRSLSTPVPIEIGLAR
ncbi:MAG: GNAT family N-acetyltransferase [Gemmatimonadales bacterium]